MIARLRRYDVRFNYAVLVLTAALVAACGTSATAPAGRAGSWPTPADIVAPEKAGFTTEGIAKLDARMKEAVDKGEVSGVITLLAHKGQVAHFKAHGVQSFDTSVPVSERTLFRIYSMTKPVTGVAMMQLYEKGLWKLDDPITKFVPELANLKVMKSKDSGLAPVSRSPTMRELMTHTAGFGYGLSPAHPVDQMFAKENPLGKPDMKSMIDTIAKLPLLARARRSLVVFDRGRYSRRDRRNDCRARTSAST